MMVDLILQTLSEADTRIYTALIAILVCLGVGVITGAVGGNMNPVFWLGVDGLFGGIGAKMNKSGRARGDLILRGFFLTAVAIFVIGILVYAVQQIFGAAPEARYGEPVLVCLFLTVGTGWVAVFRLKRALEKTAVGEGVYYALARSARVDLSNSDDFTITRVAIGQAVRGFDKGLVAPVLWYVVGGLAGLALYSLFIALSWRFGPAARASGFAVICSAFEAVMGVIPSLISAVFLSIACAITPTAMMSRALKGWSAGNGTAPYHEGGLPLTALSFGLDISVGGPVQRLAGEAVKQAWIGPKGATAQLEAIHLHRALYMVVVATFLFMAALLGLVIVQSL